MAIKMWFLSILTTIFSLLLVVTVAGLSATLGLFIIKTFLSKVFNITIGTDNE